MIKKLFDKWNNRGKCPNCKSKNIKSIVVDVIAGRACEISYDCVDCGTNVNYWAYGNLETPATKTEFIGWIWKGYAGDGIFTKIKCIIHIIFE